MFIWGAKGVVADLGHQGDRPCPTCEKERPFHLMLQYTARHFWYVFKWVTGKQYASVCAVCQRGQRLDTKTIEAKLPKPPIPFATRGSWMILVGLLAIAAVFGVIDDTSRSSSRETYLATPAKGDRYVVNVAGLMQSPQSKYLYTILRVREVKADGVEFDAATWFYPGASGPNKDMRDGKLDQPGYFSPTPIVLSRDKIARLHADHAIHSIDRAPGPGLGS
ncbi:hypothetical protein LZ009_16815 [Ramlibacter sp. XY19]|uniref:hypothetical protein n=1 Tax=Ramlibacter paludis TaxID=2908000 RepID=UPI0023DB7BDF|nr:hypothetical protein [Ramlibacter paludis]MCG2594441.1 hypothetical protein [Ramlibacter paludis]